MKLNIVIPVYNTEAYLAACIGSLLVQTHPALEIILVDDGSTDGCPGICDGYAERDARVRVFHQENQGPSAARNRGMAAATGDYVTFLDSDDYWLDPAAAEALAATAAATNADCIVFGYRKVWLGTDKRSEKTPRATALRDLALLTELETDGTFSNTACNKLIRRAFLKEHGFSFRTGVYAEDLEWCSRLIRTCGSFAACPVTVMVYQAGRAGSRTSRPRERSCDDVLRLLASEHAHILAIGDETRASLCRAFWAYQLSWFLGYPSRVSRAYCKGAERALRPYRGLLLDALDRKSRLVRDCVRVLGLPVTMRLLGLYLSLTE